MMNEAIKTLSIGADLFVLGLREGKPYVEVEERRFWLLWHLVDAYPQLSSLNCLETFAELSNFLWKGMAFHYIHDIEAYRTFYLSQVAREKQHPADVFAFRLTDYQIFDVSVMSKPFVNEQSELCYFVYQAATGLPYRVVAPFPYTATSTMVHYQILPLLSQKT